MTDGALTLWNAPDASGRWLSGGVGAWNWKPAVRRYGRWDVRVRIDPGAGTSAVALLWPHNSPWPPELDFLEVFSESGDRGQAMATTHYRAGGHRVSQHGFRRDFTRWHVVSVHWQPTYVRYYVDGQLIGGDAGNRVPHVPMWLGLQTHYEPEQVPAWQRVALERQGRSAMQIDWVRVYAPA